MWRFKSIIPVLPVTFLLRWAAISLAGDTPWTIAPYPTEQEISAVTANFRSGDPDKIAIGEQQIQDWLSGHQIIWVTWFDWFPAMMKIHHEQQVADIAAAGVNIAPAPGTATPLLEWRIKALLVLNQPTEALEAAKSYYNVCALSQTERAVQLVGLCLTQCNPNDGTIADRFRHEQAIESKIGVGAATEPSDASPAGPMLKSISVDAKLYDDGLTEWERRNRRFADRVNDANLLLVADKADQAEAIFRDLLGSARNQDQINQAYDGVARSLRAEDGNLARANAFLRGK